MTLLASLLLATLMQTQGATLTFNTPDLREPLRQVQGLTNLRAQRFQYLVMQKTDYSCGAAALATILSQAYDWPVNEYDVISGMLLEADLETVMAKGFSMLDMKRYVARLGLRARGYKVDQDALMKLRIPTIVLLDLDGYKHFVVLQRIEGNQVFLGDPARGNLMVDYDDFAASWNGLVLGIIGPGYVRDNPLVTRAAPLTLRHRHQHMRLASDNELMEFGFIQSDFFKPARSAA